MISTSAKISWRPVFGFGAILIDFRLADFAWKPLSEIVARTKNPNFVYVFSFPEIFLKASFLTWRQFGTHFWQIVLESQSPNFLPERKTSHFPYFLNSAEFSWLPITHLKRFRIQFLPDSWIRDKVWNAFLQRCLRQICLLSLELKQAMTMIPNLNADGSKAGAGVIKRLSAAKAITRALETGLETAISSLGGRRLIH